MKRVSLFTSILCLFAGNVSAQESQFSSTCQRRITTAQRLTNNYVRACERAFQAVLKMEAARDNFVKERKPKDVPAGTTLTSRQQRSRARALKSYERGIASLNSKVGRAIRRKDSACLRADRQNQYKDRLIETNCGEITTPVSE